MDLDCCYNLIRSWPLIPEPHLKTWELVTNCSNSGVRWAVKYLPDLNPSRTSHQNDPCTVGRLSTRQWSISHAVESSWFLCPINIHKVCWHSLFTRHFCSSALLFGLLSLILYQPAAVRGGAMIMYFSWIINKAKSSLCKSSTITAWSSDNCKNMLEPDTAVWLRRRR